MSMPGAALRARYAWDQSDHPLILRTRGQINARVLPFVSVVSLAGPAAPSLGYAGVPHGLGKVLQTLEARREAAGAPTTELRRARVGRARLLRGALPDADLVAVGCSAAQAAALPRRNALVLPLRLHLAIDLSGGREQWHPAISRRERQWFSARRNEADWALEVAHGEADFRFFYRQMHLPTMRSRHGERTRSEPEDSARECLLRTGRLLGVLDGAEQMYEIGALKALYHLLLDWADGAGVRRLDLGGTEAWLGTGLFQWKRRFAPRVLPAPNHLGALRVWFHARRDTPAVRDFLAANPVLELLGGPGGAEPGPGSDAARLRAVYFHDDDRPARLDLAHACPNVREYRTVHLDEFLPARSA